MLKIEVIECSSGQQKEIIIRHRDFYWKISKAFDDCVDYRFCDFLIADNAHEEDQRCWYAIYISELLCSAKLGRIELIEYETYNMDSIEILKEIQLKEFLFVMRVLHRLHIRLNIPID